MNKQMKKTKNSFFAKFLFFISLFSFITAISILGLDWYKSKQALDEANQQSEIAIKEIRSKSEKSDSLAQQELGKQLVEALKKTYKNDNVVALIEGKILPSAYPIVYPRNQKEDDYWLHHEINKKEWSKYGTLFMDRYSRSDFGSWNTTIFGHRMKNELMFGNFKYFEHQASFDKAKKEGKTRFKITSAQGTHYYEIMAVRITKLYDRRFFPNDLNEKWLKQQVEKSQIKIDFPDKAMKAKHYITLSTCTEATGPMRTVLILYQVD